MSTRNRIEFDDREWCNACQWMEEKETLDWAPRQKELENLLNKYRSKSNNFDCVVPVSGGKDGSYIAYTLQEKYNMHPLCITVRPALELQLGQENLLNFVNSGFNHIHITPNTEVMRVLNKRGFIERGRPYFGWISAMHAAVVRTAFNFNITLIFYAEDGEIEYGGSTVKKNVSHYDIKYMKDVIFEGDYYDLLGDNFSDQDLYFWKFPSEEE